MRKGGFVKMKHHTNKKKRLLWIVTGIVLIYCAILLAAHHIDRGLSPDNDSSGYGDLTERFSAKYSINYKGKVYEYRENSWSTFCAWVLTPEATRSIQTEDMEARRTS